MKKILFAILLLVSHSSLAQTTIYLVRHAEKITAKDIKDPELTQIGAFRAKNIANQLSSIGITHIYSTDFKRTMQTAEPLAQQLQLEVEKYDAKDLKAFADKITAINGKILVVGHSDTTPILTSLLSKQKIDTIHEKEYDNLYQVIIMDETVILNRFKTVPASNIKKIIRIHI